MAGSARDVLGREAELAAVGSFLEAGQNRQRALLLEGEAGIGKTSLWKQALSSANARGYRIFSSAPTEMEATLPYAVLGDLLDSVSPETISLLSDPLRTALDVALFRAPAAPAPTDQLAVSNAFLRLMRKIAADEPVVLAIDDIQWIDPPSVRVLTYAIHRLEQSDVKVVAALRLPTANDIAKALRRAVGDAQVQQLDVGPLSLKVIDELLLSRLKRPLRTPELDQVYMVSGGNPFFALEIGHFILERPAAIKAGEPIPVPQSLVDAIAGRFESLPPETRESLVAVAALARPDEGLLQRAGIKSLDPAFRSRLIETSQGRVRFSHPLLASVIYATADPIVRREWHSRLAGLVRDPEDRARHLSLAAIAPDAVVADALEDAARSADARGAPDSAASLAQQSAELTPSDLAEAIERRRILTAAYRMRAGDVPGARDLLVSVLQSAPIGYRPPEALRLMGSLTLGGQDLLQAERYLTEALSQGGNDLHTEGIIERDLIAVLSQEGKIQEAWEHSHRLTEIAAQSNDASLVAAAQRLQMLTERYLLGRLSPEARETAVALAENRMSLTIDDSSGGLHPLMNWATVLKWSDDFDDARILFKRALALTEGRDESLRAPLLLHLAEMECWAGDWLLADVYAHECEMSLLHTGQPAHARLPLNAMAMLHCCRGEFDAARAAAQKALAISTSVGDEPFLRRALAILGATELAAGNLAAANDYFDRLRSRGSHPAYRGSIRSESDEVDALLAAGRIRDAEAVCARMGGFDDPWPRAIGARGRALLAASRGDVPTSVAEFDRALDAHESLPVPLERARTLLAYGNVLRRAKQKRAAREKVDQALKIFGSLGAKAWVKRAEAELSRIAPAPSGIGLLTPTETRVAQLVASGQTNKEVAARLFLSVKTVEANLSRVYDKLHVRSRSELAAKLSTR